MKTTNRALFVAFTSQKGGVGKSTFTTLAASIMHYRLGYNVAIVDCDFPQFSISQMRERDMKMVMENTALKQAVHQQFKSLEKGAYPILKEKAESAIEAAFNLMESKGGLDIIFFDLPGTVNSAGIITTLASMDYLFIPITADRIVLESALVFTQLITDVLMQQENVTIKEAHLFWNQVDGRERNPLYTLYSDFIRSLD
jgi:cellulose biosynthesis protein BcsQ